MHVDDDYLRIVIDPYGEEAVSKSSAYEKRSISDCISSSVVQREEAEIRG